MKSMNLSGTCRSAECGDGSDRYLLGDPGDASGSARRDLPRRSRLSVAVTSRPILLLAAAALIGQACTKAGVKPAGASGTSGASVAVGASGGSSAAATTGGGPKAEIAETVFDAGTVERGVDISHAFEIKNVGQADLTVDAKPG